MSEYVNNFRFLPTETLQQRLKDKRLPSKAIEAYQQVLAEREIYVPVDLSGEVSISGHSGCYYANLDVGQVLTDFEGQSVDGFLIPDELAAEHKLGRGHKIVFRLEPNMVWVSKIVSVNGEVHDA